LTGCQPSQPTHQLAPHQHDFGTIRHGQVVEHRFPLVAATAADSRLLGLHVACTCGTASWLVTHQDGRQREVSLADITHTDGSQEVITVPAGSKIEVKVVFDSRMRPPQDAGPVPLTALVLTDIPEFTEMKFEATAHIRVPVVVRPSHDLDLGTAASGQTVSHILDLMPRSSQDTFRILAIEGESDWLRASPLREVPTAHRYRIESPSGRPEDPEWAGGKQLVLKTDLFGGYDVVVNVRLRQLPSITIDAMPVIGFGRVDFSIPQQQTVLLRSHRPDEFQVELETVELRIDQVDADANAWFSIRLQPLPQIQAVRLLLDYRGGIGGRHFDGRVLLKTNDPKLPQLELPFSGFDLRG
jgi:hypothetical protein